MHLPWESSVPPVEDPRWIGVGKEVVRLAKCSDTGPVAFAECCVAREQLESIVQAMGYDMNIYIFGGLVTTGIFEVGGDVDFVGILDVEPAFEESGEIINRASRELRRLGLRTRSFSKARVPVVKADRVSRSLPGEPFHNLSCDGIFQFSRQLTASEADGFADRAKKNYDAQVVEWNSSYQFATVQFSSTSSLIYALVNLKVYDNVEIPLRLPVDIRHGPELYRFPFDFCLSSTGLGNSYLLGESLARYPYASHLLLTLKKWGRASGIINSIDGLLASYALTVMLVHFLAVVGKIPKVSVSKLSGRADGLNPNPAYRPLVDCCDDKIGEVGFLFAAFFEYFGCIFNYKERVVCTTNLSLTKSLMKWDKKTENYGKPPFFHFSIKDPYGLDNIARNLDFDSVSFVQKSHQYAIDSLLNGMSDPALAVRLLTSDPHKPQRTVRTLSDRGIHSDVLSSAQLEAQHALNKLQFKHRKESMERLGVKAVENLENQSKATRVTNNVLGWIRSDGNN